MRDSMVFYRSFYNAIRELPDDQLAACFRAIMDYGLDGLEPDETGIAKSIYLMARPQIDANNKRYRNGCQGGRPDGNQTVTKANQSITKPNQSITKANQTVTKANQTVTKPEPNVYVNDNDNENDKINKNYCVHFERIWQAYPRKKEKAAAYKAYKARLSDGFPEDELETAVKRYADECKRLGTEERYIKHGATFFGANAPFADYIAPDYKPAKATGKRNRFDNFDQRDTDYDELAIRKLKTAMSEGDSK